MRRPLLLVAVALLLAGCGAPIGSGQVDSGDSVPGVERADPATDRLGWEDGYWYDDPIDVNVTDGLAPAERDQVIARMKARLERIRNLEFTEPVNVTVVTREQYRQNQSSATNGTHAAWNNQVWEGLFLVGEDRSIDEVFSNTLGSAVVGSYSPSQGNIVIVSDDAQPVLARGTLAHELVHALQDQQFEFDGRSPTQDEQLAESGLVEGEANLLESRYQQRCEGAWNCIETQPSVGGSGGGVDRGVLTVLIHPYIVGPEFVSAIEARSGWAGVNAAHENYPESTEQIVDPSLYPGETPVDVTVADRSTDAWSRFDHDPVADTLGQASIHTMFAVNGVNNGNVRRYGYDHPAAVGWDGDALVPYRNGDDYGYVWESVWESTADAREFRDAYLDLLEREGATESGDGVYTVPETSPFGDAFRVTLSGDRVRVVNAPTTDALDGIHAP
jgi:hypothetical protein